MHVSGSESIYPHPHWVNPSTFFACDDVPTVVHILEVCGRRSKVRVLVRKDLESIQAGL